MLGHTHARLSLTPISVLLIIANLNLTKAKKHKKIDSKAKQNKGKKRTAESTRNCGPPWSTAALWCEAHQVRELCLEGCGIESRASCGFESFTLFYNLAY